jgi:hypothetical protein
MSDGAENEVHADVSNISKSFASGRSMKGWACRLELCEHPLRIQSDDPTAAPSDNLSFSNWPTHPVRGRCNVAQRTRERVETRILTDRRTANQPSSPRLGHPRPTIYSALDWAAKKCFGGNLEK